MRFDDSAVDSEYDAVVTRQNQRADMERAAVLGMETYAEEQREKAEILRALLEKYNDGRRKTLFCVAVNLLPLPVLRGVLETLRQSADEPLKARAARAAQLLQAAGEREKIVLKLRRKPKKAKEEP